MACISPCQSGIFRFIVGFGDNDREVDLRRIAAPKRACCPLPRRARSSDHVMFDDIKEPGNQVGGRQ